MANVDVVVEDSIPRSSPQHASNNAPSVQLSSKHLDIILTNPRTRISPVEHFPVKVLEAIRSLYPIMKFFQRCLTALVQVLDLVTFSPWSNRELSQQPLFGFSSPHHHEPGSPIFYPPNGPSQIQCDYRGMGKGWRACSTPHDRGCWLRKDGIDKFDINTDYETRWPKGVTRKVYLLFYSHQSLSRCI